MTSPPVEVVSPCADANGPHTLRVSPTDALAASYSTASDDDEQPVRVTVEAATISAMREAGASIRLAYRRSPAW